MPPQTKWVVSAVVMAVLLLKRDATVAWAGASGLFELNVQIPVMGSAVLESIRLLAASSRVLADKTIDGLEANVKRARAMAESSPSIVTPLNKFIGYEAAAKIAKHAVATGLTIREATIELGYVDGTKLTLGEVAKIADGFNEQGRNARKPEAAGMDHHAIAQQAGKCRLGIRIDFLHGVSPHALPFRDDH
jgi:fumarate hydratase class II